MLVRGKAPVTLESWEGTYHLSVSCPILGPVWLYGWMDDRKDNKQYYCFDNNNIFDNKQTPRIQGTSLRSQLTGAMLPH